MLDTTEKTLYQEFSRFKSGSVERVKKILDYAFIHYRCREDAVAAQVLMNGAQIDGATVEVMLAKPPGCKDLGFAGRRHSIRGEGLGSTRPKLGRVLHKMPLLHKNNGGLRGAMDDYSPLSFMSLPGHLGSPFHTGSTESKHETKYVYLSAFKVL